LALDTPDAVTPVRKLPSPMNLVAVTLPDAASIITFPAVSPLWTMKFLLAIVPCLPYVLLYYTSALDIYGKC
jgi:hypothetical protein